MRRDKQSTPPFQPTWRSAATATLATALIAAFCNLSVLTLLRGGVFAALGNLLILAAATAVVAAPLTLGLLGLARLARPVLPGSPTWSTLLVWSGSTVVVFASLLPVWVRITRDALGDPAPPSERLVTAAALWAPLVLAPILASYAAQRISTGPESTTRRIEQTVRALLISLPAVLLATFLFVWFTIYRIEGLFSLRSVLTFAGWALASGLSLAMAFQLARRRTAGPILFAATALLLAGAGIDLASGTGSESDGPPPGAEPPARRSAREAPRAIILLTVDTLRADALTPYGAPNQTTKAPALDQLAGDSTVFLQARSAAPWTKPAMASMLTGVSPALHGTGALEARLPATLPTLAELMQDAGYTTVAFGNNPFLRQTFRFHQGFDEFYFYPFSHRGLLGAPLLRALAPRRYAGEPSTQALTDLALEWLRDNSHKPFFLWLHYFDPHGPFEPPKTFRPRGRPAPGIGHGFHRTAAIRSGEMAPDLAQREWIRQLYRAEIRYVDDNIGRLLTTLEELDLYDPSLIVFSSDHGEEFWEHGSFEHGHTLYDEVLRVPLSFKMPAASARHRIDTPVSTESVTPTLLELTGGVTAGRFSSPSLLGWLQTRTDAETSATTPVTETPTAAPVFGGAVHFYDPKESVVFDGMKYIRETLTGREELYDLRIDPLELRSIAEEAPELIARARALLADRQDAEAILRQELRLTPKAETDLDAEQRRRLQSLGYIN